MQRSSSRRPGSSWSVLTFRQRRSGRLVSGLLALSVAAVFAVGSAPAYAEDAPAPDATSTTTSTDPAPPADTGTGTDTTGTDTGSGTTTDQPSAQISDGGPQVDSSGNVVQQPAQDPAPAPAPAPTNKTALKTTTTSSFSTSATIAALVGNAACEAGTGDLIGGFQIDGDPCDEGGLDFENGPGDTTDDGFADTGDTFTGGSSESDDPATWTLGGPKPAGKADIGTAWAYSQSVGGTVYAYFGFTNDSTAGGTQDYSLEYNQADPVNGFPVRTPGDLLFHFFSGGNNALDYEASYIYTLKSDPSWSKSCVQVGTLNSGWCPKTLPGGAFTSDSSATGEFVEGAIDISAMFGSGTCSGTFGTTFLRSAPGSYWTSQMKDYVAPLAVTTPSTCATINIQKQDNVTHALVGGGVYCVDPAPAGGSDVFCIYDGAAPVPAGAPSGTTADGNADGQISVPGLEPGTYTITEVLPPPGYLLNPGGTSANSQTVTVGESETKSVTFANPKKWLPLTASVSGTGTFSALYGWSIVKEISPDGTSGWLADTTGGTPLVKQVPAGSTDATKLFYRLTTTEGARTTSTYVFSGTLAVGNTNSSAVTADLSVSLTGATCTITGGGNDRTVAAGGSSFAYSCTSATAPGGANVNATVSWDKQTYPQNQADLDAGGTYTLSPSTPATFAEQSTSQTVTVTDDNGTPADTSDDVHYGPYTWSAQGTTHSSGVYSRTVTVTAGHCSAQIANTATVASATNSDIAHDSAYGQVCLGADLTAELGNVRGFTRTYPWSVHKSTSTPNVTVSGGKATASYTVTVTTGDGTDSGWYMTGTVKVTNPNDWESVSLTGLPITYSGGGTCGVTGASFPYAVAAGASHTFDYTCTFVSKPDYTGTVTATAQWSAAAAKTPTGSDVETASITEANWTKTEVNDTVIVWDDHATPGTSGDDSHWDLTWADVQAAGGTWSHDYTIDLPIPPGGTCSSYTNTVKVLGDGNVQLDMDGNAANNSASVKVCNPLGLTVTKTAVGDFTRTYPWTITKSITNGDTWSGGLYNHTFDYDVTVTPHPYVDSAHVVSGTISIHNDNTDASIPDITVTSLTESLPGCTFDTGLPTIASGHTATIGYTCPVTSKVATNKATVGWANGGADDTGNVDVTWHAPTEVDKTIHVYDDPANGPNAPLGDGDGSVTWDEDLTPTHFTYSRTYSAPEGSAGTCTQFPNVASIQETGQDAHATATICPQPGTWTVSKVNANGDGPIAAGSTITYRLTATKTGGVNPTDVDVVDDLGDLAPYLTSDAPVVGPVPAGQSVSYDADSHELTWNIDELSGTVTLEFTVTLKPDAFGADLPNVVWSPGSSNCPNADTADGVAACNTDNDTPAYTLSKSADDLNDGDLMPPYLGADGDVLRYTLTVTNTSDAEINGDTLPGAQVTDDLSDVLDNATFVEGSLDPAGQAELVEPTLTWTLPTIAPHTSVTLSYDVRVNAGQWDKHLINEAKPGTGGTCSGTCTTDTPTPPVTQLQVLKTDYETGAGLAGAEFTLSQGDQDIESGTTDDNGELTFDALLRPGTFTVTETKAPEGYDLPVDGASQEIVIDDGNFVAGGVIEDALEFRDPATGEVLSLVKSQYERDPGSLLSGLGVTTWLPSDGVIDFGDQVKYVMDVETTGTRLYHGVTMTDYLPGWNPEDGMRTRLVDNVTGTESPVKTVLVDGTPTCSGDFECTSTYDPATGKVTWTINEKGEDAGVIRGDAKGTVEFVVTSPAAPVHPENSAFADELHLWNQARLDWQEQEVTAGAPEGTARMPARAAVLAATADMVDHSLLSNEVTERADVSGEFVSPPEAPQTPPVSQVSPPEAALPNTGGPNQLLVYAGLALLLSGGVLVLADRRRKRRS